MKCMTVVGTRPEFIQTSLVTKALRARHTDVFVNTGQHYDDSMSRVFFEELDIPTPDYNLNCGAESAGHAQQTAQIMTRLEAVVIEERPDFVLVYGDTNTTLAGGLVASKLGIPVVHIEAGLRSFDKKMPEEINRVIVDHISDVLLAPTERAVKNLREEGITKGISNVGDVRVDVLEAFLPRAKARIHGLLGEAFFARHKNFALVTVHRASNTDEAKRLKQIVNAINTVDLAVVLPVHPRLADRMTRFGVALGANIHALEPLGFLDMLALIDACQVVITDSGGLQKEAYMLRRQCVTVRDTTEWVETIDCGWNRLAEPEDLRAAVTSARHAAPAEHPDWYGTRGVSGRVVRALEAAGVH